MRIAAFPAKIARLGRCGWLQRGVCLALAEMLLDPLTVEEALTQIGERDVAVLGLGHGAGSRASGVILLFWALEDEIRDEICGV